MENVDVFSFLEVERMRSRIVELLGEADRIEAEINDPASTSAEKQESQPAYDVSIA